MTVNITQKYVIERYSDKNRLESYISRTKTGLSDDEKIIVKKYLIKNFSVLVVGCGTGREIYGLQNLGFKNVVGIDISPDMVREAKKIIPNVNFYCADINKFNVDKKYDAVLFLNNILEQIPSFTKRKSALSKAKQLLKKDGIAIFTTHSRFVPGKYGNEWLKSFVFYLLYLLKIMDNNPFDFVDRNHKIYSHYSNPFLIKETIKNLGFKTLEINSKDLILKKKKLPILWIFSEPVYYIVRNPD